MKVSNVENMMGVSPQTSKTKGGGDQNKNWTPFTVQKVAESKDTYLL